MTGQEREPDTAVVVIAHGLINTLSVVSGAAGILRESGDRLSPERSDQLLSMIEGQVGEASELLRGLVLGLDPEIVLELDELNRSAPRRRVPDTRLRDGDRRELAGDVATLRRALTEVVWEAVRRGELLGGQPASG